MPDACRIIVATLLAMVVMSVSVTFVFLSPRPYGVEITDSENDYYYNGTLIVRGYPPNGIHHPGTPIQYLSALLIQTVGGGIENTQNVLNAGRLLAGIVLALSVAVFICMLPRGTPASVALLVGAVAVACPPLLSQLDYFGPDPFVVAAALTAIVLLWRETLEHEMLRQRTLVLSGAFLGLACAIKVTALPLTVTAILAVTAMLWKPVRGKRLSWSDMAVFPVSILLSFIVFTLPIAHRYPEFIRSLLSAGGHPPFSSFQSAQDVINIVTSLPVFTIVVMAATVASMTIALRRRALPSALTLIFFLFLSLLYSISQTNSASDFMHVVHGIRFLLPSYLVIALCVHYVFLEHKPRSAPAHLGVIVCAVAILTLTISPFVTMRSHVLQEKMEIATVLESIVHDIDGMPALWHTELYLSGVLEPSVLFHYWGNLRYADERFTKDIFQHFPHVTFFNYPTAKALAGNNTNAAGKEVVVGETMGIKPSMFLFPEDMVDKYDFKERPANAWPFEGVQEELTLFLSRNYRLVLRDTFAFLPQYLQKKKSIEDFLKDELKKTTKVFIDSHPELPRLLRESRQGRTDVLAFLSERYGRPFSAYRLTIAGHPWILLSDHAPDIRQESFTLPVHITAL